MKRTAPRSRGLPPPADVSRAGESHSARVTRALGTSIVTGSHRQNELLPGDSELMQRFGVSRTVLREALKTLSAKGLIIARARIGTRVRDRSHWNFFDPDVLLWHAAGGVDRTFFHHLSEMRLALEPEAAALASQRRTDQQLEAIYDWADRMARSGGSPDDFVAADLQFHLAVAEAAANPFMHSVSTLIEVALIEVLTLSSPAEDEALLADNVAAHRAVADAIRDRDADTARSAMREVITAGLRRIDQP